jgi:hypothetical protein
MLGNTPPTVHPVRLERAKSYAFNLTFVDDDEQPYSLEGSTLRLVAKAPRRFGGAVVLTLTAELIDAAGGEARFYFQASQTDLQPGEYPCDITLVSEEEYSTPVLKAVLEIGDNTDADDTNVYDTVAPSEGFLVRMAARDVVKVRVSTATVSFDSQTLLPPGGGAGWFLVKLSDNDYDVAWVYTGDYVPESYVDIFGDLYVGASGIGGGGGSPDTY